MLNKKYEPVGLLVSDDELDFVEDEIFSSRCDILKLRYKASVKKPLHKEMISKSITPDFVGKDGIKKSTGFYEHQNQYNKGKIHTPKAKKHPCSFKTERDKAEELFKRNDFALWEAEAEQ